MDHFQSKPRWPVAALLLTSAFASGVSMHEAAADDSPDVEVFIQLDTPSVAEFNATAMRGSGEMPDGATQRAHAARVTAEQAAFRARLRSYGVTELSTQRVGANGFRVRVAPDQVENLRNLSGVRTVGTVEKHYAHNVESVPWVGAPQFWATYGMRGEGIKIGIIDTGIDYTHAAFGGPGTPAAYSSNNRNVVEPGTFPTAKVIGGWDFAGPTFNADAIGSVPQPDPDPLDGNGHGTHVAGTAAGVGVPGIVGSGVAPGAKLYALKVFGDAGGSTNLTSLAIEWAMDPNGDGDMSDHLDVINISLGARYGTSVEPSSISANNAAAVGIIVVTSAGNDGDMPYVVSAPAVADSAIAIAATTPGGRLSSRFTVNSPASVAGVKRSLESAGPVTLQQTGPITGALVAADPITGCGLTNAAALAGNIALIRRGSPGCVFTEKFRVAQVAGARAVVLFNDGADPTRIDPFVVALDPTNTIPGVMISFTDGNAIHTALDSGPVNVTLEAAVNPDLEDLIPIFSSRGPGHGGSTFKPDLSAPGAAIVSAGAGTGTGPATIQGTSMSAPHVAGAAALLRQLHPQLDQSAIKALLMNSTVDANASGDTDIARQGVGTLRVAEAAALTSYAAPAGVSFGRLNRVEGVSLRQTVVVTDMADRTRTFSIRHVPGQTYPGVSVTCPSSARVAPGASSSFDIRLQFDPAVAFTKGIYDLASASQTEVDGWCILSDGTDTLRVAYMAVVDPASQTQTRVFSSGTRVSLSNSGPSVSVAEGFTSNSRGTGRTAPAHAIADIGYRTVPVGTSSPYGTTPVLELAIRTVGKWEHISNLNIDLYLDTNGDGAEDTRLRASDRANFAVVPPGTYVTGQFAYSNGVTGAGALDWLVTGWDFNDSVVILPFTRVGGLNGRVPDAFTYRLVITGRDQSTDTQTGSIDLANEIRLEQHSVTLAPGSLLNVGVKQGSGDVLWLLPNDIEQGRYAERVRAP